MARDDDKLLYSSAWDIDQLIEQGTTTLSLSSWSGSGSPTTNSRTITLNSGINYPPVIDIMWRPQSTSISGVPRRWMQADSRVAPSIWSFQDGVGTAFFPGTRVTNGLNIYYQINSNNTIVIRGTSYNNFSGSQTVDIRYYIWGDRVTQ